MGRGIGLNTLRARVHQFIAENPGCRGVEIALGCGIPKGSIGAVLKDLEATNRAYRVRVDGDGPFWYAQGSEGVKPDLHPLYAVFGVSIPPGVLSKRGRRVAERQYRQVDPPRRHTFGIQSTMGDDLYGVSLAGGVFD